MTCRGANPSPTLWKGNGALTNYAGSAGPRPPTGNCKDKFSGFNYAKATNAELSANPQHTRYLGPFLYNPTYKNKPLPPTRLDMIHDGLSNTIFVGEVRPWCTKAALAWGWASGDNGCGQATTSVPINYDTCTGSAHPEP